MLGAAAYTHFYGHPHCRALVRSSSGHLALPKETWAMWFTVQKVFLLQYDCLIIGDLPNDKSLPPQLSSRQVCPQIVWELDGFVSGSCPICPQKTMSFPNNKQKVLSSCLLQLADSFSFVSFLSSLLLNAFFNSFFKNSFRLTSKLTGRGGGWVKR